MPCRSSIPGRACCRRRSFERWCIAPTQRIVAELRRQVPEAKIIGFPRGAGSALAASSRRCRSMRSASTGLIDRDLRARQMQTQPVQGNVDPLALLAGGAALDRAVDAVLEASRGGPLHLQSRPRHPAGDADRTRRADAGARAGRGRGMSSETRTRAASAATALAITAALVVVQCCGGRPAVRLAQGLAHHRRDRLDGRHALSAAAVRLSLRGRAGLQAVRDLQGDGAPAAYGIIINPAMVVTWAARPVARLRRAAGSGRRLVARQVRPGHRHVGRARMFSALRKDFAADRNTRSQKFYRLINEVPTVLMIPIVILVVVKPF